MLNYAGDYNADISIQKELEEAGIEVFYLPESLRENHPEMRTVVYGHLKELGITGLLKVQVFHQMMLNYYMQSLDKKFVLLDIVVAHLLKNGLRDLLLVLIMLIHKRV